MNTLNLNLAVLNLKRAENTCWGIDPHPDEHMQWLEEEILQGMKEKDIDHVFGVLGNSFTLCFVADNTEALLSMGVYERALLWSYQDTKTHNLSFSQQELNYLFSLGDPEKFMTSGDPMPERESYTLYRGVSGKGRARRIGGHSWTGSLEVARRYAYRFKNLENPSVYKITVSKKCIIAYSNDLEEDEYILRLPLFFTPRKVEG